MSIEAHAEIDALKAPARKRGDWFNKILAGFAAVLTLGMMLHISLNAVSRSFFDAPVHGTLEYTQFWYLPIVAFVGIVTAQRSKEHIEARLLFDHLPPRSQPFVQAGTDLLMLALAALIAFYSAEMAMDSQEIGRTAGVSGIVIWPATFVVPIAMTLFVICSAIDIYGDLRRACRKPDTRSTSPEEA
ncbi:TRAP transporter small permease [Nocardioides sp. BGMRC 2183]|nr:TRAP transporter small permease [Nocardioides sp. BGMRC 2183]